MMFGSSEKDRESNLIKKVQCYVQKESTQRNGSHWSWATE